MLLAVLLIVLSVVRRPLAAGRSRVRKDTRPPQVRKRKHPQSKSAPRQQPKYVQANAAEPISDSVRQLKDLKSRHDLRLSVLLAVPVGLATVLVGSVLCSAAEERVEHLSKEALHSAIS